MLLTFGTNIFRRIDDHTFQPTMLLLCGDQGIGKDTLASALVDGLGDYAKNFDVSGFDLEEAMLNLHTALVFKLDEFDRVTEKKQAALKHLLTAAFTNRRLKYDRTDEKRVVRASFIGSVNNRRPLKDYTGNRRFWLLKFKSMGFDVEAHEWERTYPGHFERPDFRAERLQILAQFEHCFKNRIQTMSKETRQALRTIAAEATPDAPHARLVQRALELVTEKPLLEPVPAREKGKCGYTLESLHEFEEKTQNLLQRLDDAGCRVMGEGKTHLYWFGEADDSASGDTKKDEKDEIDYL